MKWIKYQFICNENDNILLTKRIGYSEENLAIAEKEAYNGQYIIEEDTAEMEIEPLGVELGGTGAKTLDEVKRNLGIVGLVDKGLLTHEFASADESTPGYWRAMGTGIFHTPNYNSEGSYAGQGNYIGGAFFGFDSLGILINIVRDISDYGWDQAAGDVIQYFISDEDVYMRSNRGNSGKWYRDWVAVNVKERIGRYTGTGTYGEANPCRINVARFCKYPRVLFINYGRGHTVMFHRNTHQLGEPIQYFYIDAEGVEQEIVMTWGNDYISWYNTVGKREQLNHDWYDYNYLIL